MNQQGSQKIDAYRRASNYPAAGQLYLPDTPLLRRPLKREDVKRKLIAHKNCIHEIGQDMPEILDRKRHLPEKLYTFKLKIKPKSDYPLKTLYPRAFQTGQNHLIYYDITTVE